MEVFEDLKRFYIMDGELEVGEITYQVAGDSILIIDHTFVEDTHRGRGLGELLVQAVVDKAIKENKKIMPLCPFAAHVFKNNPKYHAVLHA